MRPLIVITGQGIARADGFNLTRRMKATPRLAALSALVRRKDRQNLDALLEACAAGGPEDLAAVLQDLRGICLKERRATLRKTAHHGTFAALAEASAQRLVAHLTTNLDGLTTTFAVRDFAACWPPFAAPARVDETVAAFQATLDRGAGLLHVPLHGEAGLLLSEPDGGVLQTCYGSPRAVEGHGSWLPSIAVGLASGVADLERRLPCARLGYALFDALATSGAQRAADLHVADHAPADLLVVGYGAEDSPTRSAYPLERRIDALVAAGRRDPGARWTALVYRPSENGHAASWFAARGFTVVPYDDGELPRVVRQALTRNLPGARCVPEPEPALLAGRDRPRP